MNKKEIIDLLTDMAEKDLHGDADLFDHPCSVAVRALIKAFDDIDVLRNLCDRSGIKGNSKREQVLVWLGNEDIY